MIRLHTVVKTYKNAAGEFKVLKGLDLTIRRGEFVAIVGKSGRRQIHPLEHEVHGH